MVSLASLRCYVRVEPHGRMDEQASNEQFLEFNDRRVLSHAGKVSKQEADDHAQSEYARFEIRRRDYKEALGQEENIRQLEEAARQLGDVKPTKGMGTDDGPFLAAFNIPGSGDMPNQFHCGSLEQRA
ncbi:MAG: hypothetical protein K9K79_08025 [Desulfohalobiaceae bacterium]|nr:hypothetical protein [Desulfohalobiaceae bacterium]